MGDNSRENNFVDIDRVMYMGAGELRSYAKECGVSLAGCTDFEQWRERLLLHHEVQVGTAYDVEHSFACRYSAFDTRMKLDQLFDKVLHAVHGMDSELHQVMVDSTAASGGTGGSNSSSPSSIKEQITIRRNCLTTTSCSVIVAGETKSGKSTFLNLLLGMDVLPSDVFSCTAAVCVLRYSPTLRADIVYLDGSRKGAQFTGVADTHDWLKKYVAEQDLAKREQGLGIDSINVYLPAAILQSGVSLVDTPGIGENDAMTNCTMDYVKRNRAAGYIYVIKTDNAGGVHDDTLLEFLRSILAHNTGENNTLSEEFDPTSAMFVCNRWDQVPLEQRDRVRANALNKLAMAWPEFQRSQTYFLSSTNAHVHYRENRRYVTGDFRSVLKGVKRVFFKASNNAVNHHYRWLKQLLHHSTTFLKTTLHQCSQTDDDLRVSWRQVKQKLDILQQKTTTTTSELRRLVRGEIRNLCGKMSSILKEKDIRAELKDWHNQTVPPQSEFPNEELWREELKIIIMRRIADKIDEVLRQRGLYKSVQDNLSAIAQRELKLVDAEIDSIRRDITGSLNCSVSSAGSSMFDDLEDESALEMLKFYKERKQHRLSSLRSVTTSYESDMVRRTAEVRTMSSVPKIKFSKILSVIKNKIRKGSLPSQDYLSQKTDEILKVVPDNQGCLLQMASKYWQKLDSFITEVDHSIPRFIASNKQMMEDITANRRKYLERRRELVTVMENLEPIREMLRGFGSLYIQDLTADNINFVLDQEQRRRSVVTVSVVGRQGSSRSLGLSRDSGIGQSYTVRNSQGLWNSYRWGVVEFGDKQEHLMGRNYVQGIGEDMLIKEIARLRCLQFEDLAPFLGMSRLEEESAVFLFLGDLSSARRYLMRAFHEPANAVPRLLEGVLRGLAYLHREGLVHMELSMDTIMVNMDGEPKLCGACLPRTANFPPDSHLVNAEPFVCLSPEVLRGSLYTAEDDCYSFGLVVWEMCRQEKPYDKQRNGLSLKEFTDNVHPSSMLGLGTDEKLVQELSENQALKTILHGCLLPARGLRIKMDPELREAVSALRLDPMVQSLSNTFRRNNGRVIRRTSNESNTSVGSN